MILKRIAPLSCARIAGFLYALLGLLVGAIASLFAVAGGFASEKSAGPIIGLLFGAGAVIILPVFYGCIGFVFAFLGAAVYNFLASRVGGIELDLQ